MKELIGSVAILATAYWLTFGMAMGKSVTDANVQSCDKQQKVAMLERGSTESVCQR